MCVLMTTHIIELQENGRRLTQEEIIHFEPNVGILRGHSATVTRSFDQFACPMLYKCIFKKAFPLPFVASLNILCHK